MRLSERKEGSFISIIKSKIHCHTLLALLAFHVVKSEEWRHKSSQEIWQKENVDVHDDEDDYTDET